MIGQRGRRIGERPDRFERARARARLKENKRNNSFVDVVGELNALLRNHKTSSRARLRRLEIFAEGFVPLETLLRVLPRDARRDLLPSLRVLHRVTLRHRLDGAREEPALLFAPPVLILRGGGLGFVV